MAGRSVLLICLSAAILASTLATQDSERSDHKVKLTIYQMSVEEWNSKLDEFKTALGSYAETYCQANSADCGLVSGFVFTSTQVGIASEPEMKSKSLKVSIYMDFPTIHVVANTSSTTYVLQSSAVQTIIANNIDALESVLGHDITYIDKEFYGISPDADLNKILIPIAFLVIFLMVILAVALHMWNNRREQESKKKLQQEKRKLKTSQVRPMHSMESDDKQTLSFWPLRSKSRKAKVAGASRTNGVATLSMKTSMMTYGSNGASSHNSRPRTTETTVVYDEKRGHRNNALPPLPNEDKAGHDEERRLKRERRSKKKEPKKHRREEDGGGETGGEDVDKSVDSADHHVVPVEEDDQNTASTMLDPQV